MNGAVRDSEIIRVLKPFIQFWQGSNEPWWVKNNQSRFVYANRRFINLLSLPDLYDIDGRFDGELPSPLHEFEVQIHAHDRMTEKERERVSSIGIQKYNHLDYLQPWYSEKVPLMNEAGDVLGVICHARPVEAVFITRLAKIKMPTTLVFNPPNGLFTDREWEIIFYTCQLFTPKMIERAIGVSNRTIEDVLGRIYKKADVGNKRGLIDYCIENGFNNFIPQSIFKTCESIIPFGS